MKLIITVISFLFFFSFSTNAQKLKINLVLNDGTELKGYGKFKENKMFPLLKQKIQYWPSWKSKDKTTYKITDIKKLILHHGGYKQYYEKHKLKGSTSEQLFERILAGNVSLYSLTTYSYSTIGSGMNNGLVTTSIEKEINYYVKRASETTVSNLGESKHDDPKPILKLFNAQNNHELALEYFSDCPDLVEEIKEKPSKFNDSSFAFEVVNYYNSHCNKKTETQSLINQEKKENPFLNSFLSSSKLKKENLTYKYNQDNFSSIWSQTASFNILGIIGNQNQRIRIKILSIKKDTENNLNYFVQGKTSIKDSIRDFNGTISIKEIISVRQKYRI